MVGNLFFFLETLPSRVPLLLFYFPKFCDCTKVFCKVSPPWWVSFPPPSWNLFTSISLSLAERLVCEKIQVSVSRRKHSLAVAHRVPPKELGAQRCPMAELAQRPHFTGQELDGHLFTQITLNGQFCISHKSQRISIIYRKMEKEKKYTNLKQYFFILIQFLKIHFNRL